MDVGEIIKAFVIKNLSTYKRFESKRSIFNAIVKEMDKRYGE